MTQRTFLLGAALLLAGCPKSTTAGPTGSGPVPPPTATPPPTVAVATATATATAPTTTATTTATATVDPSTAPWLGEWRSNSCGKRRYTRLLTLTADGQFSAQDRVSPCPPKVACVWSGIIDYSGSWRLEGNTMTLTHDPAKSSGPKTIPLLTTLTWSAGDKAPSEASDAGRCLYARP